MATPTSSMNTISQRALSALSAQAALLEAIRSGHPDKIEAAVSEWELLARHIPQDHPDYEPVIASHAVALLLQWEYSGDIKVLQQAIIMLDSALTNMSSDSTPNRYENLANLGAAYLDHYETLQKDPDDLMRAIECWEEAHLIAGTLGLVEGSAKEILKHLGEALFYTYEVGVADVEAVPRAIKHFVVFHAHCGEEKQASIRYRIGECYFALYKRFKSWEDLDAAIEHFRASIEGRLDGDERQSALMELTRTLAIKFDVSREQSDLEEAIRLARVTFKENQGEPWILRNLANLLYWMFKAVDDSKALDEAIEYYELAWALYQAKPRRNLADFYYSFGTALLRRYDEETVDRRTGKPLDIERAVYLLQLAVGSVHPEQRDDYRQRLDSAIYRKNRTASNPNTHYTPLTRSNALGFPHAPNNAVASSCTGQQPESFRPSSTPRRAQTPLLPSQPNESPTIAFSTAWRSRASSHPESTVHCSEAPSECTIVGRRVLSHFDSFYKE